MGVLVDRSGWAAFVGKIAYKGIQLAVDEANQDGGVLGQEVEMVAPDPASDIKKYKNLTQKVILEDDVDVLIGALSSAAREAIRPIVDEEKQLYFYFMSYEGGLCDEYTFVTGSAASQKVKPLVEYMTEEFGPEGYIVSADYNFGHISALWARYYLDQSGGEVVGEEFVPQDVSEFGSTINRIEAADPDWIMTMLVSAPNTSFWKQANSAGLDVPQASPNIVSVGFEHQRLSPPALENMHFTTNYIQEMPGAENRQFVSNWMETFSDTTYINQSGFGAYVATKMYLNAVEETGTVDQKEVHDRLENGMSLTAAGQSVALHPPTHHLQMDVPMVRIDADHNLEFLSTNEDVLPSRWERERCSLDSESSWEDPHTEQIVPDQGDL